MNKTTEEKYVSALEWAQEMGGNEIHSKMGAENAVDCYRTSIKIIEKKSKGPSEKVKKFHVKHKEAIADLKEAVGSLEEANSKIKDRLCRWYEQNVYEGDLERTAAMRAMEDILALEAEGKMEEAAVLRSNFPPDEEEENDFTLSGVQFREKWSFEVENIAEIPREFLTPDMSKIREAVKSVRGVVKIPGIRAKKEALAYISKK